MKQSDAHTKRSNINWGILIFGSSRECNYYSACFDCFFLISTSFFQDPVRSVVKPLFYINRSGFCRKISIDHTAGCSSL